MLVCHNLPFSLPTLFFSLFVQSKDSERLKGMDFKSKLKSICTPPPANNRTDLEVVDEDHSDIREIKVECYQTTCVFEFTIFEFKGETELPPNLPPGSSGPIPPRGQASQAGNIALIIPSQILPQLDQNKIQDFLNGNVAIKLQARTPRSPIQFILPTG